MLFGCHHDLIRRGAATAAAAHAVSHDRQQAAVDARVLQERHLVLLVFAITLVDAGRCGESITFAHVQQPEGQSPRLVGVKDVLSKQAGR